MKTNQLDLLIPEQLPSENELSESNKKKVLLALKIALKSLDIDCQKQTILQIDRALIILKQTEIFTVNFSKKDTQKNRDFLDYDNYFNVNHVKSKEPEICLVRSVLIAYKSFILLCNYSSTFNFENIEIQRQGFRSYFQLLSRVFNSSLN